MPNKTRSIIQPKRSFSSSLTRSQLRQRSSPNHDPPLTSQSQQQLLTTHHLLQLTFHRNKNQHRRAKWWKWLSMLYRSVGKLLALTEGLETGARRRPAPDASVVNVHGAKRMAPVSRQSIVFDRTRSKWDDRVVYLRQGIVPGCYRYGIPYYPCSFLLNGARCWLLRGVAVCCFFALQSTCFDASWILFKMCVIKHRRPKFLWSRKGYTFL